MVAMDKTRTAGRKKAGRRAPGVGAAPAAENSPRPPTLAGSRNVLLLLRAGVHYSSSPRDGWQSSPIQSRPHRSPYQSPQTNPITMPSASAMPAQMKAAGGVMSGGHRQLSRHDLTADPDPFGPGRNVFGLVCAASQTLDQWRSVRRNLVLRHPCGDGLSCDPASLGNGYGSACFRNDGASSVIHGYVE